MSAQPAFTLSVSESCKSNAVARLTFLRLADFATFIKSQPPVSDKLQSKGVVASLFSGGIRTVENVSSVTAVCLDFDEQIEGQLEAVSAVLQDAGISHVGFASFSNNGRCAFVIPLSTPTSIAGHAATVEYLRSVLGPYAKFSPESSRAAQLRFISANADNPDRELVVFDGQLLAPRQPVETPAPTSSPVSFDAFSDVARPHEKQLFLIALRNNLLNHDRLDAYERWSAVLFAAFRAWGVAKKRNDLTDEQRELLEALNVWSSQHEKYRAGCVEAKIGDHLTRSSNTLTIQSLIKMETDHDRLRACVRTEESVDFDDRIELDRALTRLVGGTSVTQVTVINEDALKEAQSERAVEQAKREAERKWGQGILARMPAPTARFAEFRDIVTAIATQGNAEFWELPENQWPERFFLRPIPILMSLAQIASLGFMPHTLFRLGEGVSSKALNLYFLHIAAAGTGKSEVFKSVHAILEETVFRFCNPREKLHSATGLWVNHFERTGSLQMMTSEEAESLFGKFGNIDQHLSALHTCVKELFDKGIPGKGYRPSAQVQREIEEVIAPSLVLNLAGTPRLLAGDITETMLGDGFMSRMITYINDKDPSAQTEAEKLAAKLALMESSAEKGVDANAVWAGRFFKELWQASGHPSGPKFFDAPVDADRDMLVGAIREHFSNPDLEPRYIRPGRTKDDRARAAKLQLRAEQRYVIPKGLRGLPAEEAISSLVTRAQLKLNVLTAILTLIADPKAEYLDLEIMEWAEEVLYVAQRDFYQHLLGSDAGLTSIMPKYRINTDALSKLKPAIEPGGLLYSGDMVKSSELRASSKAWRRFISDLKADPQSERGKIAHEMLVELGIGYYDDPDGKNCRMFFIKPETKDEE